MTIDFLTISGHVHAVLTNEDGSIAWEHEGDNLVVDSGLLLVVKHLAGTSTSAVVQMGVGSGIDWPTPQGSITALETIPSGTVTYTFVSGDIVTAQPATGQATVTFTGRWTSTQNNFTITEVGLLAAGPTLVARYVFPSPYIPKTSSQTLAITYVLTMSAT